jgi:cellulose biosynthesis protein BcsQ
MEHKFNKQVSVSHIDLDPQMSLYMLAAWEMGIEARGILFNVIRVAEGGIAAKEPVVRRQVYRNQEGLALIKAEISIQMDEMREFHEGNGRVFRNPTKDCSWDCGFFATCLSMNDDGDAASALARVPCVPYVPRQEEVDSGE